MAMVSRTWNGLTLQHKIDRAAGRAIVGIGVLASVETKRVTHKVTGTLSRSVHAAEPMEYHESDEVDAAGGADLMMDAGQLHAAKTYVGRVIEVGSWISYACAEWVGRGHPGVTQGLEVSRGVRADNIVKQAFMEEGLK
jgi:hypothetical protein